MFGAPTCEGGPVGCHEHWAFEPVGPVERHEWPKFTPRDELMLLENQCRLWDEELWHWAIATVEKVFLVVVAWLRKTS